MHQQLTLSEVLDSNELAIIDSSAFDFRYHYPRCFIAIHDYSHLREDMLDQFIKDYHKAAQIFNHTHVATIHEVSDEIRRPLVTLEKMSKRIKSSVGISRGRIKLDDKLKLSREAIQEAYNAARSSELPLLDPKYETLVDILKLTNVSFGFDFYDYKWKKDMSLAGRTRAFHGPRLSKDTDERLAAALMYNLIYSDKTPTLISRDADFINLLRDSIGIMSAECFMTENIEFAHAVRNRNFRFYFGINGVWGLRAHRKMVREYNVAMINRRLGENSKAYFAEMRSLWERFSSYPVLQT